MIAATQRRANIERWATQPEAQGFDAIGGRHTTKLYPSIVKRHNDRWRVYYAQLVACCQCGAILDYGQQCEHMRFSAPVGDDEWPTVYGFNEGVYFVYWRAWLPVRTLEE